MYHELRWAYNREKEAAEERYFAGLEMFCRSPDEFAETGKGIKDAVIFSIHQESRGKVLVSLGDFALNFTNFRPGTDVDLLLQNTIHGDNMVRMEGTIESLSLANHVVTVLIAGSVPNHREDEKWVLVEKCFSPNLEAKYAQAQKQTAVALHAQRSLIANDPKESGVVIQDRDLLETVLRDASESQRALIQTFFSTGSSLRDIALIQGPPGTGKTRVLAKIAKVLLADGKKVGLCAFTNTALDNAILAVLREASGTHVFRCGEGTDLLSGIKQVDQLGNRPFSRRLEQDTSGLFAATMYRWIYRTSSDFCELDVLLMDEAAQIPLHLGGFALMLAPALALFGDDAQLGPIFRAEHPDHIARSLFVHFRSYRGNESVLALRHTWRMNDVICSVVSKIFYEQVFGITIEAEPEAAARRLAPPDAEIAFCDAALWCVNSLVWVKAGGGSCRAENRDQAERIATIVGSLEQSGNNIDEICVVTPYRRQAVRIAEALNATGASKTPIVDTIERMQGQEADIVIFSLPSTDSAYLNDNILMFMFHPNRLNVAISRARKKVLSVQGNNSC